MTNNHNGWSEHHKVQPHHYNIYHGCVLLLMNLPWFYNKHIFCIFWSYIDKLKITYPPIYENNKRENKDMQKKTKWVLINLQQQAPVTIQTCIVMIKLKSDWLAGVSVTRGHRREWEGIMHSTQYVCIHPIWWESACLLHVSWEQRTRNVIRSDKWSSTKAREQHR